ncbi:unnamed protein product [Sphenostylis stenocarpa]|uniref:C2H2-type domain-containing protein n=1 Tax=Sphenostylis stenocarpa TaxID=92480 RepID=A0AA86SMH2_9FABA|nr:unnamed protein product [Sphenostylis stenocarpa]
MDLSGKRVSGEGSSSSGGAGASNLQLVPYSENKKVCRFCQREFKCGRSLGGHIKVHNKSRRTIKFTHKKKSNRRGFGSSSTPASLRVENGASGAAPVRIVERGAEITEPAMIDNRETGAQIHDVSMSLLGCGWRTKRRRGSNEETNHTIIVNHSYSQDEYVECDVEDSCDEDDYDNIKLRKWLRGRGYATGAHKICWTRRMLMCKVCNQYFRNLSGVITHVDECALSNSEMEMENVRNEEVDQVDGEAGEQQEGNGEGEVGRMPEDAALRKGNGGSSGVGEKQPMPTSAATPKKPQLDLNQMPPTVKD